MSIAHDMLSFGRGKRAYALHGYTHGNEAPRLATVVVVYGIDRMESESGSEIRSLTSWPGGRSDRMATLHGS